MKNNELEKLLSVSMALEHFGISRSTLYKLTKTELPFVMIRSRKFFRITKHPKHPRPRMGRFHSPTHLPSTDFYFYPWMVF